MNNTIEKFDRVFIERRQQFNLCENYFETENFDFEYYIILIQNNRDLVFEEFIERFNINIDDLNKVNEIPIKH